VGADQLGSQPGDADYRHRMFRRRTRYERNALALTATMSEQERLESRCMGAVSLAMHGDGVDVMAATRESAARHAEHLAHLGGELGIEVGGLPEVASAAVVVGAIDDFVAHPDSARAEGRIALVEGEPPASVRTTLSRYQAVKLA
jgi:hypothetical protein